MTTYLSKDGTYLINEVNRHRKHFSHDTYFIIDNWWYDFKVKNKREPSPSEMQQMCARRGIAGIVNGKPTTFPDESMMGIYSRLRSTPDPIIRACLGESGHCAPLHMYRDYKPFYMSADAYYGPLKNGKRSGGIRDSIIKRMEEEKVLKSMSR